MKKSNLLKKTGAFLFTSAVALALLIGCSSNSKNTQSSGGVGEELPEITWKISHTQAPDHFMNTVMENMAAAVSEKTDGKFKIEIYHSGTLGSEQDVIEGMQMGTIAGNLASVSLLANFVPSYDVFNLPCIFKDEEAIKTVMSDDELMNPFREAALEQNIIEVGHFQDYFRMIFSKEPIRNVADFEGQKIRIMSSPVLVDTFQQLGCNSTTTAWSELYSGLQLGVVDGLDHVSTSVRSMNFYDHVKYMSDVKIFATPMFLVISKPLYDELPDTYKDVLNDAMKNALEELNTVANDTNTADIEFLKENGVELVDCDVDAIHKAVIPIRDEYIQQMEPWVQEVAQKIMDIK